MTFWALAAVVAAWWVVGMVVAGKMLPQTNAPQVAVPVRPETATEPKLAA